MDSEVVAQIIEEIHTDETAPDFYNNEQALISVVKIAYIVRSTRYQCFFIASPPNFLFALALKYVIIFL